MPRRRCRFHDDVRRGLDVVKSQLARACHVDQHARRAVDRRLQQRAGNGGHRGLLCLVAARRGADAHVRVARILHDRGYVREVEVDDHVLAVADEFGDRADRLLQHIVRDAECVGERDLLVGDKFQPVIRNDDQRVDLVGQIRNAHLGLTHPVRTLKFERLRHNADGQNPLVVRDLRNDRGRAGARAAAHTGGDEGHLRALEGGGDLVAALLRAALADLGVGARAASLRQLRAKLHLLCGFGGKQRLLINSTPRRPLCTMRLTAFPPPPPTPMTLMFVIFCSSSSRINATRIPPKDNFVLYTKY